MEFKIVFLGILALWQEKPSQVRIVVLNKKWSIKYSYSQVYYRRRVKLTSSVIFLLYVLEQPLSNLITKRCTSWEESSSEFISNNDSSNSWISNSNKSNACLKSKAKNVWASKLTFLSNKRLQFEEMLKFQSWSKLTWIGNKNAQCSALHTNFGGRNCHRPPRGRRTWWSLRTSSSLPWPRKFSDGDQQQKQSRSIEAAENWTQNE